MRLPPGVSSADFSDAIKQFQDAVGKEWVFTSDEDVDLYRDSYSPFWHEDEEPIPSAAVAPGRRRAGAGGRQDRKQVQDSTLDNFDREKSRLRRFGSASRRQRDARPEAHGPYSRGQREESLRAG